MAGVVVAPAAPALGAPSAVVVAIVVASAVVEVVVPAIVVVAVVVAVVAFVVTAAAPAAAVVGETIFLSGTLPGSLPRPPVVLLLITAVIRVVVIVASDLWSRVLAVRRLAPARHLPLKRPTWRAILLAVISIGIPPLSSRRLLLPTVVVLLLTDSPIDRSALPFVVPLLPLAQPAFAPSVAGTAACFAQQLLRFLFGRQVLQRLGIVYTFNFVATRIGKSCGSKEIIIEAGA